MAPVGGGQAKFWWLLAMRCSGEAPGGKVVGQWTGSRVAGRKKRLYGVACQRRSGSVMGEERRQARVEVIGMFGMIGEDPIVDAHLGVGQGNRGMVGGGWHWLGPHGGAGGGRMAASGAWRVPFIVA
jgi:hypothetical protein